MHKDSFGLVTVKSVINSLEEHRKMKKSMQMNCQKLPWTSKQMWLPPFTGNCKGGGNTVCGSSYSYLI